MSFINPLFLFATAAALLPVLYHLVRRMKAKTVPFSSLMFLRATPKEVVRKRRLRDLLLMAVRSAIFGLLALVFARPFLPEEAVPFIPQREHASVVLLVDRSYSMRYGDAFEAARREALARLDAAGPDDEVALVAFADEARQLTDLSTDRALLRSALGTVDPSYRTTDFDKALRLADEILQGARHETRTVVLLSDFQAGGWTGSLGNWQLASGTTFVPVDVGAGAADNAFIQEVHLDQRRAGPQVALRFDARVSAQGRPAEQENAATLTLGDAAVDRRPLPARPGRTVSFQQMAAREGVFQGTLALEPDALPADDRYFFTYHVAPRPSILVVDEPPAAGERDAFFLRHAFDLGDDAPYTFTSGGPDRLTPGELRRHQLVVVANLDGLSAARAASLRAYAGAGGTVVFSFGDRVNPAAFAPHLRTLGVGHLEGPVDARAELGHDVIIGEVDLRHPIFSIFAGTSAGAILRPRFHRYVRVAPDSGTAVLGTYDSGDPFLLERRVGDGKVLVYTATFNTSWTDFPVDELYVPFLYQLARYARDGNEPRRHFLVGETVRLRGTPGDEWEVRAPGNGLYRVRLDSSGTGFFRETEEPGHYVAAGGREPYFFSVNVDPRESDLQARDPDELYAAVAPPPEHAARTPEQAAALVIEDEEKQQKLWRYLLLLVVGLFAFETYYANRRTNNTAGKTTQTRRPGVVNGGS